jgi:hypothetical protein
MTDDEIKRYRLDPNKPRQLTPEEQERLDKASIDYSDIPPLFGEDWMRPCCWQWWSNTVQPIRRKPADE